MVLRGLRAVVGVLLGASGALLYAASAERWSCAGGRCEYLEDHRYDFLPPADPWEPVGQAAQLAGWSLLVLAVAVLLLPWALTGRRPGIPTAVAVVAAAPAVGAVGLATLRSGMTGSVVEPLGGATAAVLWSLVLPILLVRFALAARGWPLAASLLLIVATPLVAAFSYAVGSYDARPWWEGVSGLLTLAAGACLLVAAALGGRAPGRADALPTAVPVPTRAGRATG